MLQYLGCGNLFSGDILEKLSWEIPKKSTFQGGKQDRPLCILVLYALPKYLY